MQKICWNSPRLTPKVTDKQLDNIALDTDFKQEVFAATVPIEDDEDWRAADKEHTFIGIFMALDNHAERRRDHEPARTLAVNDRPYEDATFKFEKINQDEPNNNKWEPIGEAIYTGSIASTADNIKVKAYPKSGKNISHANWFVTWGPTAKNADKYRFAKEVFRAPQGKKADAGNKSASVNLDMFPNDKKPRAGFYRIGCVIRFQKSGTTEGAVSEFISRPLRVGVRTDDAIVFGWINPDGVSLPSPAEAKGDITKILPPQGLAAGNNKVVPNINTAQTGLDLTTSTLPSPAPPYITPGFVKRLNALYKVGKAGLVLGQLAECEDNPYNPGSRTLVSLYVDITKLMPTGYDPKRLKFGRVFSEETGPGDRKYALYWQFKYAANENSNSSVKRTAVSVQKSDDFKGASGKVIDYARLRRFSNLRQTNWVTEDPVLGTVASKVPNVFLPVVGTFELGKGGTVYKMLNHFQVRYLLDGATGTKIESMQPLSHAMQRTWIGITADPLTEILGLTGQKGPLQGRVSAPGGAQGYRNTGVIRQTNDGSPDDKGVKNFATLTRGLDKFWENIGSQIYFEKDKFGPTMMAQTYPTYEMFVNGTHTKTDPQAEEPLGHFYYSPYPFGRGKTSGIFNPSGFQGGRNGKSIPPAPQPQVHPSARQAPIEQGMPR